MLPLIRNRSSNLTLYADSLHLFCLPSTMTSSMLRAVTPIAASFSELAGPSIRDGDSIIKKKADLRKCARRIIKGMDPKVKILECRSPGAMVAVSGVRALAGIAKPALLQRMWFRGCLWG